MPAGEWEAQAVLDPEHTYNYSGRGPADWVSPVESLGHYKAGVGAKPVLTLDEHPAMDPRRMAAVAAGNGGGEGGFRRKGRDGEHGVDAVLGQVNDGAGVGGASAGISGASRGAVSYGVLDGGIRRELRERARAGGHAAGADGCGEDAADDLGDAG